MKRRLIFVAKLIAYCAMCVAGGVAFAIGVDTFAVHIPGGVPLGLAMAFGTLATGMLWWAITGKTIDNYLDYKP